MISKAKAKIKRARADQATKGYWTIIGHTLDPNIVDKSGWIIAHQVCSGVKNDNESGAKNAPLLAHSRTDIPEYDDALTEAMKALDKRSVGHEACCRDIISEKVCVCGWNDTKYLLRKWKKK